MRGSGVFAAKIGSDGTLGGGGGPWAPSNGAMLAPSWNPIGSNFGVFNVEIRGLVPKTTASTYGGLFERFQGHCGVSSTSADLT